MKTATMKPSKFRGEADVLKQLGLTKAAEAEKLSKEDHNRIAEAAKAASLSLRKALPKAANALYYVAYKHSGMAAKRAKVAAKAKPARKAARNGK